MIFTGERLCTSYSTTYRLNWEHIRGFSHGRFELLSTYPRQLTVAENISWRHHSGWDNPEFNIFLLTTALCISFLLRFQVRSQEHGFRSKNEFENVTHLKLLYFLSDLPHCDIIRPEYVGFSIQRSCYKDLAILFPRFHIYGFMFHVTERF